MLVGVDMLASIRKLIIGLSKAAPDLVVTIITPLAPRIQYIAVAVASFRIENPSITSGSRAFKSVVVDSMPSIMISGEVLALPSVETPRIQKLAPSAPGSPLRCTAITPAKRPAKEVERLDAGTFRSAGRIDCTEPTILAFFCPVPYAVTTTSSKFLASSCNVIIIFWRFPTFISCVA